MLKQLYYIPAIAKTGSLSSAAMECGVAQSTVSRHLDQLEDMLGFRLFIRSHRGFELTEAGAVYTHAAEQILHTMRQTENAIINAISKQHKRILFGATAFAGSSMVASAFNDFFTLYPNTKIEIQEGGTRQCIEWLRTGAIDLGIISAETNIVTIPGVEWISMEKSEIVIEIPIYHSLAQSVLTKAENNRFVNLTELSTVPLILPGKNSVSRSALEAVFSEIQLHPVVSYETTNINLLHLLAQRGLGISFLPAHNVEQWQAEKSVIAHTQPVSYVYNGIGFASNKQLNDEEKALISFILRNRDELEGITPVHNRAAQEILRELEERHPWTSRSLSIL